MPQRPATRFCQTCSRPTPSAETHADSRDRDASSAHGQSGGDPVTSGARSCIVGPQCGDTARSLACSDLLHAQRDDAGNELERQEQRRTDDRRQSFDRQRSRAARARAGRASDWRSIRRSRRAAAAVRRARRRPACVLRRRFARNSSRVLPGASVYVGADVAQDVRVAAADRRPARARPCGSEAASSATNSLCSASIAPLRVSRPGASVSACRTYDSTAIWSSNSMNR